MEAVVDRRALDDLGEARRDEIVPDADMLAAAVLGDIRGNLLEPRFYTGIELDDLALRDEVLAVDPNARRLRLLVE